MFSEFDVFFDKANNCYQVRTTANCFVLNFDDEEKQQVFESMMKMPKGELSQIFQKLKKDFDDSKVIDVFSNLKDYGLLPFDQIGAIPELAGESTNENAEPLPSLRELDVLKVLVISDSRIGEILKDVLVANSVKDAQLISAELFASLTPEQLDETVGLQDFCFMDGSRWNPKAIELINKYAIKQSKPWLHIGGFEEHLLKIGPLFLGNETGCYSCFMKRKKSNHEYVEYFGAYEKHLRENGQSSKSDKFIHEDAYYGLLANMAFIELTKFIQMWSVPTTWRKMITINALDFETMQHDLLKVPFCEVCNEIQTYNPSPWLEPISI